MKKIFIVCLALFLLMGCNSKTEDLTTQNNNVEEQDSKQRVASDFIIQIEHSDNPEGYTELRTIDDVQNINENLSGKYILMNDIDFSEIDDWKAIGNKEKPFTGIFDGNGYKLKRLNKNYQEGDNNDESNPYSFFGWISEATIKNVGLTDGNISLVNSAMTNHYQNVVVENCYNKNNVKGNSGLINFASTSESYALVINSCYNTGNVSGDYVSNYCGGIVGSVSGNIEVKNCYNTGNINAEWSAGGIIGSGDSYNNELIISQCYNEGEIVGEKNAAGIIATTDHHVTIENCYNTGDIYVTQYYYGYNQYGLVVESSRATGIVGEGKRGGGTVNNVFNIGKTYTTEENGSTISPNNENKYRDPISSSLVEVRFSGCYSTNDFDEIVGSDSRLMDLNSFNDPEMFKTFDFESVWQIKNEKEYPTLRVFDQE